jgi:hypothetical protein
MRLTVAAEGDAEASLEDLPAEASPRQAAVERLYQHGIQDGAVDYPLASDEADKVPTHSNPIQQNHSNNRIKKI